jgi:hypothetical protein
MEDVSDRGKLKHPRTGNWVTRKMAEDLGFVDEAEEATRRFLEDQAQREQQEARDHRAKRSAEPGNLGMDIEDFLEDEDGDFSSVASDDDIDIGVSAEEIRDLAGQLEDSEDDALDDERVLERDQWMDGWDDSSPRHVGPSTKPFYSSKSRDRRGRADRESDGRTPDIDKREKDWKDTGRKYTRDQDGGMRVSND